MEYAHTRTHTRTHMHTYTHTHEHTYTHTHIQVASKNMPMGSLIVGVDLVPIKQIHGVKTMLGDITTQVRFCVCP